MTKYLLSLILGILLGLCGTVLLHPRHECPLLQTTLDNKNPGHIKFITTRINELEWTDSDGSLRRFGVSEQPLPSQNLVLKSTERLHIPDDHGNITLRLIDISQNKATIAYVNEFMHLSFGKNLITIDCGVIQIDIFKRP